MSRYQTFVFKSYAFDPTSKTVSLHYSYDNELNFTETFTFDFEFSTYDPQVLDTALQHLFLLAGVSYYKAYLAPSILIDTAAVTSSLAEFLSVTYQKGLGEFFFVNKLGPTTEVKFIANAADSTVQTNAGSGLLVGLGGGKDSLVTLEALRNAPQVATWSVGHRDKLAPLVATTGLPHLWVERVWDRQLLTLNKAGAYNGHVPISAILAAAGTVTAILGGYSDVVVSNEHSANEPTLEYQGVQINHQYSKSLAFETNYQQLLQQSFGDSLRYYSFLRPLSELHIAELFCANGFQTYKGVFSSCNRAYALGSAMGWCGECPKCAFVYLILANFCAETDLVELFTGKNLLLDAGLENTYRALLGIEGDKPLECIGEIQESRAAMRTMQAVYPALEKFRFVLDENYDYKFLHEHAMPPKVYQHLLSIIG